MTQREVILNHFNKYNTITSWEAIQLYGITKVNAVIFHLRQEGYKITSTNKTVTTKLGNTTTISVYKFVSAPVRQTAIQFNSEYNV